MSVEALLKTNLSLGTLHKPPDQETGMSLMGAYNRAMGRIEKLQAITTSSLSNPEEIEESTHDLLDEAWRLWPNVLQNYSTSKLTYQHHLLPALSGLARRLYEVSLSTYLAGLWWTDLYHQVA